MPVSLKHAHTAVGTNAGTGEVRKEEWNAEHALTMANMAVLGRIAAGTGAVQELALADVAALRAGTAAAVVEAGTIYSAAAAVALTDATTIAVNFAAGRNFTVTLGGNRTLGNPTNQVAGQGGLILIKQPASGGPRTLSYANNWFIAGGAPTLSTAANAVDGLAYFVESSGTIRATFHKGFAAS